MPAPYQPHTTRPYLTNRTYRQNAGALVHRVVAETLVGHAASRRVMEKAGMRLHGQRLGEVDGEPAELVVYEALAGPVGYGDGRAGPGPDAAPAGGL